MIMHGFWTRSRSQEEFRMLDFTCQSGFSVGARREQGQDLEIERDGYRPRPGVEQRRHDRYSQLPDVVQDTQPGKGK